MRQNPYTSTHCPPIGLLVAGAIGLAIPLIGLFAWLAWQWHTGAAVPTAGRRAALHSVRAPHQPGMRLWLYRHGHLVAPVC